MKTFAKLFAVLAVLAIGFTSCGDDETTTTPGIALQGDLIVAGGNYTVTVNVTCPAEGVLDNVTAKYYYNDGKSSQNIAKSNIVITKTNDQLWFVAITFPGMEGDFIVEEIKVTATTKDGGNTTETFTLITSSNPIEYTATSITVVEGKTYGYKQGSTIGTFKVTAATSGSVTIEIGGKTVTLSDAGNSYLSKTFDGMNLAAATANPENVLFCLLSESTNVASGTLATRPAIADGATETLFTANPID